MKRNSDRLDRGLLLSAFFHGGILLLVLFSPSLFPMQGDVRWGTETGGSGGIAVEVTGSLSGIPLPSPEVVNNDAVANESPGLHESEPAPEPPPVEKAEPVPDTKAPVKTTPPPEPARPASSKASKAPPRENPANAVPFGEGGRPALSYGQYSTGAGSAGAAVGDGVFGSQYGYYVEALTRKISQNWIQALVDTKITRAPRVYLTFEIARDGTISNVGVKQSSNIPSLDRSAQRAIYASNPLSPLPAGYRGQSVTVTFYFEYVR
jgi:protein TonB